MRPSAALLIALSFPLACDASPRTEPSRQAAEGPAREPSDSSSIDSVAQAPPTVSAALAPLDLPAVDPKLVASTQTYIESRVEAATGPELQTALYGALAVLDRDRLPEPLVRLLASLQDASLSQSERERAVVDHFLSGGESLAPLGAVCHWDLSLLLADLTDKTLDEPTKTTLAFCRCRFGDAVLVTPSELAANWSAVLLAHVVHAQLERGGAPHPLERRMLRLLATRTGPPLPASALQKINAFFAPRRTLPPAELAVLRSRLGDALARLEAGDLRAYVEEYEHPYIIPSMRAMARDGWHRNRRDILHEPSGAADVRVAWLQKRRRWLEDRRDMLRLSLTQLPRVTKGGSEVIFTEVGKKHRRWLKAVKFEGTWYLF